MMIGLELCLGIVVALLVTICTHKYFDNRYKKEVAFEKMLRSLEEQQYESDVEMLELLSGKRFPEDTRRFMLSPEGHAFVVWILEHQEKQI